MCKEEEEEANEAAKNYKAEEADGEEVDGVIYGRCVPRFMALSFLVFSPRSFFVRY